MEVGRKIKELRIKQNISQTKLGKISGVPQATLSAYESEKFNPTLANLLRIMKALDTTLEELTAENK